MDTIQNLIFITVDAEGFISGHISSSAINIHNMYSIVYINPPNTPISGFQKWRWLDNAWVIENDYRGYSWYNPDNTSQVHRPKTFNDEPPDGWIFWVPGTSKIISEAEKQNTRWEGVRTIRNRLLSESDWVVVKAMEMGIQVPEDWYLYRQALRGITEQPDPYIIEWPLKPGTSSNIVFTVGNM